MCKFLSPNTNLSTCITIFFSSHLEEKSFFQLFKANLFFQKCYWSHTIHLTKFCFYLCPHRDNSQINTSCWHLSFELQPHIVHTEQLTSPLKSECTELNCIIIPAKCICLASTQITLLKCKSNQISMLKIFNAYS